MIKLGKIELTVVKEHNTVPVSDFPVILPNEGTIDLASVAIDLTGDLDGVLLQAVVNWETLFDPSPGNLTFAGFAFVDFELLRDGVVIYRVSQTAPQEQVSATENSGLVLPTFRVATLLHLDTEPLTGHAGIVTYTLRATNITLVPPQNDTPGLVQAQVAAVTLIAQEVEGRTRGSGPVFKGIERVLVDENVAAQSPSTQGGQSVLLGLGFPVLVPAGGTIDLATIGINLGGDRDGILLMAAINWSLIFTVRSDVDFLLLRAGSATVTFELLRDGVVINRMTQSVPQAIVSFEANETLFSVTTDSAAMLQFDTTGLTATPGFVTYTLRATNVSIINPVVSSGTISSQVSVGAVTLIAEEIETRFKRDEGGEL